MTNLFNGESIIVKQSPIVIIKNFILFELAVITAFFLATGLANYVAIYRKLFIAATISFQIAEFSAIFIGQTVLICYIFLRWYKHYYDIRRDKIIHNWGILYKHHEIIPLTSFDRVSYHSGPVAKILKYGTVDLIGQRPIRILHIPDPQKYSEFITELKESVSPQNQVNGKGDINSLIAQPENVNLEFKSSFRWDFNQGKVNKGLERSIMKTVTAFLNSNGGQLVIGVDDKKNVVGVGHDYKTLPRPNADSFENHFSQVFHSMIGPEFRQFVELSSHKIGNSEVIMINVFPSKKPAYLKSDGSEEFYIRTGNKTTSLKFSEASSYIDSRWHGLLL